MGEGEEGREIEEQLELQLQEQRDSVAAVQEALTSDPSNFELISVHEELVQAIKDAEEGLFHLKRSRLLQEADIALGIANNALEDVKGESLNPKDVPVEPLDPEDVPVEPLEDYTIGSKCKFRHSDGRWYNGLIVGLEGQRAAKVSFLTPTSEKMTMCKFFLQQRCRFGTNCRLSHGIDMPLSSLKKFTPTMLDQSMVGSTIWATSDGKSGIWRKAELESWDDKLQLGGVVFRDDRSCSKLGTDSITLSEYAEMSNDDEDPGSDSSVSDQSDSTNDEEEDEEEAGLGFLDSSTLQRGIQTDTVIFAKWENHTRGIASKMMANMGYTEGMGLGVSGQGMLNPISVKALPPKQSLDYAFESEENGAHDKNQENPGKKRSRGGKRKRDKKFAAAERAKKEKEESSTDVFALINTQLANHGEALNGGVLGKRNRSTKDSGEGNKEEGRKALVGYEKEVMQLKIKVEKLEEMAGRNKKEKVVYEAALRKLNETRKTLAEVEAAQASASNAVNSKEREKRWLKF